jgi:hypothetical protein
VSHTMGSSGRNNSKPSNGSSGHSGGRRPDQTHKKPKDLSVREREEGGCGEGGGVYVVCM